MNGKKMALVAGLAAIAVLSWVLLRGGRDAAPGAGGGSGVAGAGASGGAAGGSQASADDRVHPIRPPIHVGPGGVEPDLEGVPAMEPPPPPPAIDAPPPPSLSDQLAAEPRDPAWANEHEREIKKRLGALPTDGIDLEGTECRAHQCRITFTATDDHALGRFVAHLEESEGLYGYAHMIVLEAITDTPDGRRQERVYARFE